MKLAVINTGGTISCAGKPLAPMSAADFAAACTALVHPILAQSYPQLTVEYLTDVVFPGSRSGTLDSTNLQPTDWCLIARTILTRYADYDGWVVLHGTDTMDFSGAALPFLLSMFAPDGTATAVLSKPVILTGSQLPMFQREHPAQLPSGLVPDSDALPNFCGAIAAAQSGIPEVGVFFDHQLFRSSRVRKTSTHALAAFTSPNYPALARYDSGLNLAKDHLLRGPASPARSLDNAPVRAQTLAQLDYIHAHIHQYPVMQLNAFPAWYSFPASPADATPRAGLLAQIIQACTAPELGLQGLVLESYGAGNFPSGDPDTPANGATYQALAAASERGVVVVNCTQVLHGAVNSSTYAAGAWLPATGALHPGDMTPMAAFAKLMVLRTAAGHHGWSLSDVKHLVQQNLLGEMHGVGPMDPHPTD